MQIDFRLQLATIVITAMAGTALVVSIILLWFSLGGEQQITSMLEIYVAVTAVITAIGILILRTSTIQQPPTTDQPEQQPEQQPAT